MRQSEDKQLRDFEIRQWFYILRNQYISEGMDETMAMEQAYDDIGMRYCLRRTSVRNAKNAGSHLNPKDRPRLTVDFHQNISRLKQIISRLEKAIDESK